MVVALTMERSFERKQNDIFCGGELIKREETVAQKILNLEFDEKTKFQELFYREVIFAW